MVEGLDSICDLLRLYQVNESVYLRHSDSPAHRDCIWAVEKLYTDILEYQAQLICYLSKSAIKRAYRGTFELDGWKALLGKVTDSDKQCDNYFKLISVDKEHQFFSQNLSYERQLSGIQERISKMYESSQIREQQYRQDDRETALLRILSSDYKTDKDSNSARVVGTCEWFFEDQRFLDWRDSKSSKLLWVSAGPGCGKSVLARALVDERRVCTNVMASTVCYFFFKDGQEQRMHGTNALCAILHQLFHNTNNLIAHGLPSHKSYGDHLKPNFSELWEILVKAAEDPEAGEIVCILDALDECKMNERDQLITKLVSFFSKTEIHQNRSFPLKFLVTSRPYDDLEGNFGRLSDASTYVHFDSTNKSPRIAEEISLVIDAKIPDIARNFSAEDRESIRKRLKEMNNRTYLWLLLTIDIIAGSRSKYSKRSSIDELLSNLPPKVSDAYERILDRSSDKERARILLQLIVAIKRPLSLEEANVALTLATQKAPRSYKELDLWPSSSFASTVQNICGLFVSIHDGKLSLIHQTAREFLLKTSDSHSTDPDKWQGCLDIATAHGRISQVCIDYLSFNDLCSVDDESRWKNDFRWEDESLRLFKYAALNWPDHYNLQSSELAKDSRKAAQMLCDRGASENHWFHIYGRTRYAFLSETLQQTSLVIASLLGLLYAVEGFLNEGADVHAQSDYFGSALVAASAGGHYQVVQMLLEKGADVNAQGGEYGNALQAASHGGHYQVVQMLLEKGADINPQGGIFGTALQAASHGGHYQVVQMLLEKGADINARGGHYSNALQAASRGGHYQVVQMLLEKGADINPQGGIFGTALQAASHGGHYQVVQMLLEKGADINARGGHYSNALQAASAEGHYQVVQMLLEKGADVNAQGGEYGNALQAASHGGHYQVVQMLLEKGADINPQGGIFGTALQAASHGGHYQVVQMLLEKGADINARGGHYSNALQAASRGGHYQVVQMLLEKGADINPQGGIFGTALQAASHGGHYQVVQMLLEKGADINARGGHYSNALQAASAEGHYQVVQMLLEKGADVNAQGGEYGNALGAALDDGDEQIVLLLLEKGANLESANLSRSKLRQLQRLLRVGTNLEQANLSKHLQKVQELLERANVDAPDRESISSAVSSSTSS